MAHAAFRRVMTACVHLLLHRSTRNRGSIGSSSSSSDGRSRSRSRSNGSCSGTSSGSAGSGYGDGSDGGDSRSGVWRA